MRAEINFGTRKSRSKIPRPFYGDSGFRRNGMLCKIKLTGLRLACWISAYAGMTAFYISPFRRKPESYCYGRGFFPFYIPRAEIYFGTV